MSRRTLYIADLDGTLLTPEKTVSEATCTILNRLMEQGLPFTVATARTIATVRPILAPLHIRLPMILMNGVCIWEPMQQRFDQVAWMDPDAVRRILELLKLHGLQSFVYTIGDDGLNTWYEDLSAPTAKDFVEERVKMGKRFTRIDDLRSCIPMGVVYCSVSYPKSLLQPVFDALREDARLNISYYRDVYARDMWYLELSAAGASKASAVASLRDRLGFARVVSFGDNFNDLPMFSVSDESCAVANAAPEVRLKATRVIGSNADDGVAAYLENCWEKG